MQRLIRWIYRQFTCSTQKICANTNRRFISKYMASL